MSNSKSPPDYPDDMRDLFEDSEDENVDKSGQQSPESSRHETSGELEQTKTMRKRSEDEANSTSLNDGDLEDLVYFPCNYVIFCSDGELESDTKEASSKLRHQSKPSIRKNWGKEKAWRIAVSSQ